MNKKNITLLIFLVAFLLTLAMGAFIIIRNYNGIEIISDTNANADEESDDYIDIAGKRYSGYKELDIYAIDSVPFVNQYLEEYNHSKISFEGVPTIFVMVDGSTFETANELVQKMALSNSSSAGYVEMSTYNAENYEIALNILTAPTGPTSYLLVGGVLDGDRGYFFQTSIGREDEFNIYTDDFQDILEFNHPRNPKSIVNFFIEVINQRATSEWFLPFDDSKLDDPTITTRKQNGDVFLSEI